MIIPARLPLLLMLPALVSFSGSRREAPGAEMTRAANAFLGTLTAEQRAKAVFAFADSERVNWHFIPRTRLGLPLKEMTEPQRAAARRLLEAGIGQKGYLKASTIMELEIVLREMGGDPNVRDPERYFFSVFGTPSGREPWGWRYEGHHLSLNFTVTADSLVATAPAFFGANPAHVRSGSRQGLRALAAEEDLARELMASLDESQRAIAIITADAPRDIVTGNRGTVSLLSPVGIAVSQLKPEQTARLVKLIDEYLARVSDEVRVARRRTLEQTDFGKVTFAWAGTLEPGGAHYYRIQGPSFLIEYDNTQNDANHIHSVWRDFDGDFGRDLLREHYRTADHHRKD